MSSFGRLLCAFAIALALSMPLAGADYRMRIVAISSFESARVLASADLEFDRDVAVEGMRMLHPDGEDMPFYFAPVPGGQRQGRLFWMWDEMPFFHEMHYTLLMSRGDWSGDAYGDGEIGEKVREQKFLLSNSTFEELDEDGQPVSWSLSGSAEVSQEQAYRGSNSIRIVDGGGITSETVALKPDTGYRLSYWFKIVSREDTGTNLQSVSGQIQFLPGPGQRRITRMFRHYRTVGRDEEDYLNQWVRFAPRHDASPDETGAGFIQVSTIGFEGEVYVDNVVLEEEPRGHPHRMEIGELEEVAGGE